MFIEKSITKPNFGQYAKATLFTVIGSAGSGSSLYLNVTFGLLFNPIVAVGFGLADLAFFSISTVVRQAGGWRIKLRLMQLVFLVMSCIAAGFHLFEIFEQRANDAARVTERVETARRNAETARAELARITETGDVASLERQYKIKQGAADADAARGNCGTEVKRKTFLDCQKLQSEAAEMQERIGSAKRRDELEATKREAEIIASETETKADAMTSIARTIGTSSDNLFLAIMGLVLVTFLLCSLLAEEAGEMWAEIIKGRKAWKASLAPVEPQEERKAARPVDIRPARPVLVPAAPKTVEEDFLYQLQMMVMEAGGRLETSIRSELAPKMGVARATLGDWLEKWQAEGEIEYHRKGNKTVIRIPRAA